MGGYKYKPIECVRTKVRCQYDQKTKSYACEIGDKAGFSPNIEFVLYPKRNTHILMNEYGIIEIPAQDGEICCYKLVSPSGDSTLIKCTPKHTPSQRPTKPTRHYRPQTQIQEEDTEPRTWDEYLEWLLKDEEMRELMLKPSKPTKLIIAEFPQGNPIYIDEYP